jgi:hypothetical protein
MDKVNFYRHFFIFQKSRFPQKVVEYLIIISFYVLPKITKAYWNYYNTL